jgi:hypothetical protein
MNAYMVMHNMIIGNERSQDLDYSFYDLMGHPMRVQKREQRVARFINSCHAIPNNDVHDDLQSDLIED